MGLSRADKKAIAKYAKKSGAGAYHVWEMKRGKRTIRLTRSPLSLVRAKQFARIGAREGKYTRGVFDGQTLIASYLGGSGSKL